MRDEGVRVPFFDLEAQHEEIAQDLDDAWRRVSSSGLFVGGLEVDHFEESWAAYCGVGHAVGVANGTDALILTLRALGIGAGDEVLVPANTFIATAEAVLAVGATPRFVDVDPDSLVVTAQTLESAITARTAAAIVVHLYGHVPDMESIAEMADRAKIVVIEDAAQAHGATRGTRRAGSFGMAGCFSFYPTKNLGAMGDGGAVVTDDGALADRIRELADHGRSATDRAAHVSVGVNSRLDALQAAILSAKLTRLDDWTASRRRIARTYRDGLEGCALKMVDPPVGCESAYHLFVVRSDDRDGFRAALAHKGIQTGIHYRVPCHLQQPYSEYARGALPVVERAADEIVSLPLFPKILESDVGAVVEASVEAVKGPA